MPLPSSLCWLYWHPWTAALEYFRIILCSRIRIRVGSWLGSRDNGQDILCKYCPCPYPLYVGWWVVTFQWWPYCHRWTGALQYFRMRLYRQPCVLTLFPRMCFASSDVGGAEKTFPCKHTAVVDLNRLWQKWNSEKLQINVWSLRWPNFSYSLRGSNFYWILYILNIFILH